MTVTLAEAVAHLDPRVSRRTLVRIIVAAGLEPAGYRPARGRGRPAAEYPLDQLAEAHAAWVRGALTCAA